MSGPFISIAVKSILARRTSAILTLLSIAVAVALLSGVEKLRSAARSGFENTISGTDLIVGARTSELNLLLSTIFRIGAPAANIDYETYELFAERPNVAWTAPLSLGDSHKGFRVVGSTEAFYDNFKYGAKRPLEFSNGRPPTARLDAAIGADVARKLGYGLGEKILISHGIVSAAFAEHRDTNFEVVGILEATGTPVDKAVYVTLEGIEAAHEGWVNGAPPPTRRGALGGSRMRQETSSENQARTEDDHDHDHDHDHDADYEAGHDYEEAAEHLHDHDHDHDHDHEHTNETEAESASITSSDGAEDDHDHDHDHDHDETNETKAEPVSGASSDLAEEVHNHDDDHNDGDDHGDDHDHDHLEPGQITAFLVGMKSPTAVLAFQRDVNTFRGEALRAVIPGLALAQLWELLGAAETALRAISLVVVAAGLLGMITALLSNLNERRREIAVLRAAGARSSDVISLLVAEATLISLAGAFIGVSVTALAFGPLAPIIAENYGAPITPVGVTPFDIGIIVAVAVIGALSGLVPAIVAYRKSLADGLTVEL
ncbi:MAG: ABC transporter permease [Pseudomonadota bacterium]